MKEFIRNFLDRGFAIVAGLCATGVVGILLLGASLVTLKGVSSLSIDFISRPMTEGGAAGGVAHQIVGTLILFATTLVIAFPLSLATAFVRSVYLNNRMALRKLFTFFLYVLNGIPSIIFGLLGFFFFVKYLNWGKSWLTGGILLAFMILPTTALALSQGIDRIPRDYLETGRSLGLTTTNLIYSIILPQSWSSFISGLLLGLARAIGETAPIMFTATVFAGATWPTGIRDNPVLSLPYHIFNLAQESYDPRALQNAWGSAAILIVLVLILSVAAIPFRMKSHEEAKSI